MILSDFLPISARDMVQRGWKDVDFVVVSGDAYVDHPSFAAAIIGRVLESRGYRVGIIAQPDWKNIDSYKVFGKPKFGFLVGSGNIDSMVNHYTVAKKRRRTDSYSPGGKGGLRPDRALITYCNGIRQAYKDSPIVIGGIEASLRRFAHYDYWDDRVRSSVLLDSGADILVYGMGERQIVQIADALSCNVEAKYINYVNGTVFKTGELDFLMGEYIEIPSYEEVCQDKRSYAKAFRMQHENQDPIRGKVLVQRHGKSYVVQNIPVMPLGREELDGLYLIPFKRNYHPIYKKDGGIPALTEVKFSITSERGCFGSCSFCAITFHQGRIVQSRSHESIEKEAREMTNDADFKGYIHDVGGPTANFRNAACDNQLKHGSCKSRQCLYPKPCENLKIDHSDYAQLLKKLRKIDGVKKVFVRSGIRYDYLMADKNRKGFMKELCNHHVSGQLKVAPEHISENVLSLMGKPGGKTFDNFVKLYRNTNAEIGKEQYMIPYLMSSHPGSRVKDAIKLAEYLRDSGLYPEQVQDFYPTPGTLSTTMYYTGLNPLTMEEVYVPKDPREKAIQRALLQYKNPQNYELVKKALIKENREDLFGFSNIALIRPRHKEKIDECEAPKRNKKTNGKKTVRGKVKKGQRDRRNNR
nr:YgiQ family radical SAM protein [Peptoclostridium litorale]